MITDNIISFKFLKYANSLKYEGPFACSAELHKLVCCTHYRFLVEIIVQLNFGVSAKMFKQKLFILAVCIILNENTIHIKILLLNIHSITVFKLNYYRYLHDIYV